MRTQYWIIASCIVIFLANCREEDPINAKQLEVVSIADKVASHHLQNLTGTAGPYGWSQATYYIGLSKFSKNVVGNKYYDVIYQWAEKGNWKLQRHVNNANRHAYGIVLCDLYDQTGDEMIINDVKHTFDSLVAHVEDGNDMWRWNDLLFMSPSILPRLRGYYDHENYNTFLVDKFEDVHQLLFNNEYGLYFRDHTFINRINSNGNKIFWLRGNGWVISGLCQIIENLDKNSIEYQYFTDLFIDLAYSLLTYQTDEGYWNSNLTDNTEFNQIESSGAAMICYGLTFGVNNNLLPKGDFDAAILKAWDELEKIVTNEGRVSYVQPTGDRPAPSDSLNYYNYAAGAFLLAATELNQYFNND